MKRFIFLLVSLVLEACLLVGCGMQRMTVGGSSMLPTLADGARVLIDSSAYSKAEPQRGDIVAFRADGKVMIKRVVGLPGDAIAFKDGKVLVNGEEIQEEYLNEQALTQGEDLDQVQDNSVYVLGDNRTISTDSRSLGCIPYEDIIGKVILK